VTYDLRFENAYSGFLQKTEQTLWEGRSVDEIVTLQATMHGGWIKNPISAVGVIYNRSESGFTVQFQAHDGMRKAVRAHFRQVGDDIAAYVDNCGWDGVFPTGTLMDDAKFTESAATAANGSGYGVYDIVAGVAETVAGLPEDAESITVNVGRLTVETGADLSVAVPVSGDGFIEFKGTGETSGNFTFGKFLTAQDQVVATDTPISALSVTAGEMGGAWCNSSGTLNLEPIQLQWNDERTSFTVQFHWMNDKGYLKAVCAQFS